MDVGNGRAEAAQLMPVRAPSPMMMTPFSTVTVPAPKKSDSFQPASVLPSNSERHSPVAGAVAGLAI